MARAPLPAIDPLHREVSKMRLITASALSLLLVGCAGRSSADRITGPELAARIAAGTAPVIVDVRSEREFKAGHVPGALHLPFWAALSRAGEIPGPRDAPVVVYCEHGPRATLARASLRSRGFTSILLLEGHMHGWREAGLPIESAPRAGS